MSTHRFTAFPLSALAAISLGAAGFAASPARAQEPPASSIESICIYSDLITKPEMIPFFKAAGYNTYQCWDMAWLRPPEEHEAYYKEMAEGIRRVQDAGFKVYVLVSTNMNQRRTADQPGYEMQFDPYDDALMEERYEYIATGVRKLRGADGFTICAGDPGGHENSDMKKFIEVTRRMLEIFEREAPEAERSVNLWAVFYWDHFPSPFELPGWERDVEMQREYIAIPDILGPDVNVEFPLHNYYRSLALKLYREAGKEPELVPTAQDIRMLKDRGVKRLWAWPYFLTDECDDGYDTTTSGLTQGETRYIKRIVDIGRGLGLNGMVANSFGTNIFAEQLNLYAFARFCREPELTPEQVIRDYAAIVSQPETVDDLVEIFKFIENHSTWQAGLPEQDRLENFAVDGIETPEDALERLAKVKPRDAWPHPFVQSPAAYLKKIEERLNILVDEAKKNG